MQIPSQFFPAALPFEGPQNLSTIFPQFFQNSSSPRAPAKCFYNSSSFGASGLAWGRIVDGKIVEELWK
jgi:hypothetical protein